MNEPLHREVILLNEALELPAPERAAYLDVACAGDAALRQRVETLLQLHGQAESFLETPAAGSDFKRTIAMNSPPTERAGDRIGRYKLLQQIGEGGCGVVYMAEQEEPVRRRVALKVIKLGMDTKQVIARFEAERQALALMDHPNIAKVLDAGATETGRPYFVMELVRGIKITDFCDENKLSTADRLKLFIQVCQAIQHAHQKGVIHRDIKPSNILVTINDGVPVPKVIDFGIAKATAGRLTDQTIFTAFEQFIGTPAYMSPEQAVMTSLDIDTRSDIYSLGVLLYELLTGKTPFDAKELLAAGLDSMRRTIREIEPPKPSTRLGTMAADALTTTARQHHTDAPKLIHLLRGDLDWIAMKCLEKDRMRRYETASGLVSDIQRHLSNEPIVARPPSRFYRFQKSVHRNKLAYAATAAIATVLLFGSVISTWQAIRATHAQREQKRLRDAAETARASETVARQQAEAAAKKSANVLSFIRDMVARAGSEYADRVTVLQMLDRSTNNAASQFQNQPDVSGSIQFSLGLCYSRIGKWDQARSFLERALALQDQLYGYENLETLLTARELASVAFSQGRREEAMTRYHKIMDSVKTASGKPQIDPDKKASYRTLELWACRKLAEFYMEEGQSAEASAFVTQLVKAAEGGELSDIEAGHAWSHAAELALAEGRLQEALVACEKETSYYQTPQIVQRAWAEGMRGAVYLAMGDYAKAEPLITNSLPTLQKRFGESHFRVRRAFRDLVSLYTRTARPEMAAEWERRLAEPDAAAVEKEWPVPAPTVADFSKEYATNDWIIRLRNSAFSAKTLKRMEDGTWDVNLQGTAIDDLTILHGAPISSLRLGNTAVSDLTPLRGMALKFLELFHTKVTDLRPIEGMPLRYLHVSGTSVTDLLALSGMPLTSLRLHDCAKLTDLSPLADCRELKHVTLPPNAENFEFLRNLSKLERISFKEDSSSGWRPDKTAAEFWKEYDAKKK